MAEAIFITSETPEIIIEMVDGNLRLSGWERNEFQAESEGGDDLRAEHKDNRVVVKCYAHCTMRVPRRSSLTIKRVNGDARLKSLDQAAVIENVGGDLVLRQTAALTINNVGGDLSAKIVEGAFTVKFVGGDLSVRGVAGDFSSDKVGGDLNLREANASAVARGVGADTRLDLNFWPGKEYSFQSGADIICRLPLEASARFEIQSGGDINVSAPNAKVDGNAHRKSVTLGDGAAPVAMRAGGDVSITTLSGERDSTGEDLGGMTDELSAHIETQLSEHMASLEKDLTERLGKLDSILGGKFVNAEEIAAKARRAAEKIAKAETRRAEKIARVEIRRGEKAQRRAESAERRAERRAERGKFGWSIDLGRAFAAPRPPTPPKPPGPSSDPVSDEERMVILRMVEQGKISVEEAEKLLTALEGKEK